MTSPIIATLEKLLGGPRDGALLRFSLATEWRKAGDPLRAVPYYRQALERDPHYSAAWKGLGHALADSGDDDGALDAWHQGIVAATAKGDMQAAKEMTVFARRIEKARGEAKPADSAGTPPAGDEDRP